MRAMMMWLPWLLLGCEPYSDIPESYLESCFRDEDCSDDLICASFTISGATGLEDIQKACTYVCAQDGECPEVTCTEAYAETTGCEVGTVGRACVGDSLTTQDNVCAPSQETSASTDTSTGTTSGS